MDFQRYALRPTAIMFGFLALVLNGCATFSADGGLDQVAAMTSERIGQAVQLSKADGAADSTNDGVRQLLSKPLTPDTAVRIALLSNRGLQASFAELGIAEADLVQAGRIRNPGVSFGRLHSGDEIEIDRRIMFDLVGLLTLPIRSGIEERRFKQAKLQAASQAVQLAVQLPNAMARLNTDEMIQEIMRAARFKQ